VICVKCGVAIKKISTATCTPKDKTIAVVLAVFLGLWTWLYTYRIDGWKFWLNLGLSIVTLLIWVPIAWIWAIIDTAVKPSQFYTEYPN